MTTSSSKFVALFPFGYFAATRIAGLRDFSYLVATSWLPAVWLLFRLAGLDLVQSALAFFIGYMAFISIYELGYLVNDDWDARRSGQGRLRADFEMSWAFIILFVALRLGLWVAIGTVTGWMASPLWLSGYAVLIIAISQHNLVRRNELRVASFYELAALRFTLPILSQIPAASLAPTLFVALIPYGFPRLLAYMESKDLLRLERRRSPSFGVLLQLSFAPMITFFAYLLKSEVMVELLFYYLAIHLAWWAVVALQQTRKGRVRLEHPS